MAGHSFIPEETPCAFTFTTRPPVCTPPTSSDSASTGLAPTSIVIGARFPTTSPSSWTAMSGRSNPSAPAKMIMLKELHNEVLLFVKI
ncbi:MAG: hypothetical protein JWP06_269 [Candidatus Saccharibacteria bacterium]|nr:hypothetical protein [Candidatus Saccharibacteria bacterium]